MKGAHIHACNGPIIYLPSILCILIEIISRAFKGEKSFDDLKFGAFIGRFPSDGAACMAVKGLRREGRLLPCYHSSVSAVC